MNGVPSGEEPSRVLSLQGLIGVSGEELLDMVEECGTVTHYVVTPGLASAMLIFATQRDAEAGHARLRNARLGERPDEYVVKFGKNPTLSDEELSRLLLVPPHKTNFLISPPPSPPDDWIPGPEDGPNSLQAPDVDEPIVLDSHVVLLSTDSQDMPNIHFEPA